MDFRRIQGLLSGTTGLIRRRLRNAQVWLALRSTRQKAVILSLAAATLASFLLRRALEDIWSGHTTYIGTFFLNFSQNHLQLSRLLHVCLNVVPDVEFLVLALAGLAYLMPALISRIEGNRALRRVVTATFVVFALLTVLVNAINREEEDHTKDDLNRTIKTQTRKLDEVSSSNSQLLRYFVSNKGLSEAERRENIEKSLRNEYILSHDPIDPEILAGAQMPPEAWMNRRLHELGESWTVSDDKSRRMIPTRPRSYVTFEDIPRFTGPNPGNSEGFQFQPGNVICFNVHYRASGPNPVEVNEIATVLYLEPNTDTDTQNGMLTDFTGYIEKERKEVKLASTTMSPGDSHFVTAFEPAASPMQKVIVTQELLDNLRIGSTVTFVMAEITYRDGDVLHHERECLWLQTPASPPGIWHQCDVFNRSD